MRFEELEDVLVAEEFGDFVANAFVFGTLSAEDAALARKARKPILALPSAVSAGSSACSAMDPPPPWRRFLLRIAGAKSS